MLRAAVLGPAPATYSSPRTRFGGGSDGNAARRKWGGDPEDGARWRAGGAGGTAARRVRARAAAAHGSGCKLVSGARLRTDGPGGAGAAGEGRGSVGLLPERVPRLGLAA